MLSIPKYIRITQTKEQENEYSVFNSKTGDEYVIDQTMYDILREINNTLLSNEEDCEKIIKKYASNFEEIKEILFGEKFLVYNLEKEMNNVLPPKEIEFPLKTITIELTNLCSLNCIHCYGAFGKSVKRMEYSFEEIKQLKKELDYLHVQSIVLTGGDVFLNKEATEIILFLLENGFKVTVLSNGWNEIVSFCECVKEYQLKMVFSLDGLEETHDYIRGRKGSFKHVLHAIDIANMFDNISIGINTTVMKQNISEIERLQEYIRISYPNIPINVGLIIPIEGVNQSFEIEDFEKIYTACPSVLRKFVKENVRKERCQGGISICSIDADRNVTICAAARGDKFMLGNIADRKLSDIWINPPLHIKQMRNEKHLDRKKCKKCKENEKCKNIQDCRIYAEKYCDDMRGANPICCFLADKINLKQQEE